MIVEMNHMSFTVSDVDTSAAFYRDVLGLVLADIGCRDVEFSSRVTGIEGAELRIAYLSAPNCSVELIQYLSPKGKRIDTCTCNVGSAHVCFIVDDFQDMIGRLQAADAHFVGEQCVVPSGPNKGRLVLYFQDPDGNTVEIISRKV